MKQFIHLFLIIISSLAYIEGKDALSESIQTDAIVHDLNNLLDSDNTQRHRSLAITYLNQCNSVSGQNKCCASNACTNAGHFGTMIVDEGSCSGANACLNAGRYVYMLECMLTCWHVHSST